MVGDSAAVGPVLIADDDVDGRAVAASTFARAGFDTIEAGTGDEALEAARRTVPVLAILEVSLPGLSGYEVCHQLRQEFGQGLPIVFVSSQRTEAFDRVAGLLVGADDYLVKPFAADELLARTRRLIRRAALVLP